MKLLIFALTRVCRFLKLKALCKVPISPGIMSLRAQFKCLLHGWKFSGLLNSGFWGWLKIMNLVDYNSVTHLLSLSLKTFNHLNWKLLIFCRHNASFDIWISKAQDFQNLEFSSMLLVVQLRENLMVHANIITNRQTSLGICSVWSTPLLFTLWKLANWYIGKASHYSWAGPSSTCQRNAI